MPALDPFLFHHLVESFHVNIGGRLAPLSIRDQMTRGWMAVARAVEQGLIHGARDLLVVGAGVGGVTAAMAAAAAGIKVTLMDHAARPFSRHAGCRRWVDPTQYDWPVGHWPTASIPWPTATPPPLPTPPLRWPAANRAHSLIGNWTTQLNNFLLTPAGGNLTPQYLTRCLGVTSPSPGTPPGLVTVKWVRVDRFGNLTNLTGTTSFGLVISARGFGDERCFLEWPAPSLPWNGHPFRGFEFWGNDPFERLNLGVPPRAGDESRPRVLISGGGDGAMQDFLRIMSRYGSAAEVWRNLGLNRAVADQVHAILRDAEDQASRALVWGGGADHDHDVLIRLEQAHQLAVTIVLGVPGIVATLGGIVRSDVAEIHLAHSCTHLGMAYGLNRFLTLLLIAYLENHTAYGPPRNVHWNGWRVVEVDCQLHPANPSRDAWMCHGKPHLVTLWPETDCRTRHATGTFPPPPPLPLTAPPPAAQIQQEFDVIVMRHGIIAPDLRSKRDGRLRVKLGRQIIPYHYPA